MAKASEKLSHPVFGKIEWLPKYSHWSAQISLPTGRRLGVIVAPDGDRYECLKQAADLFKWVLNNERRILREAIQTVLLALCNDWRQDDEPELTADELAEHLQWQLLEISDSEAYPVELRYGDGGLFGGHTVVVQLDAELRLSDSYLWG
jgi:hypothetical protein